MIRFIRNIYTEKVLDIFCFFEINQNLECKKAVRKVFPDCSVFQLVNQLQYSQSCLE